MYKRNKGKKKQEEEDENENPVLDFKGNKYEVNKERSKDSSKMRML